MTMTTTPTSMPTNPGWFSRAEAWLDSKGNGAWIAAMVLGFIFFWPVGLAILIYATWGKPKFKKSGSSRHMSQAWATLRPTGNAAFDTYKADTLRRLEEEQENFEAFLKRLREAKDQSEFDQFMDDRAKTARQNRETDDS